MKAEIVPLSSIEPDGMNANKHTERGEFFVRQSMQKFGYAEAGTLDKNNRIIGGNLRTEVAHDVLDADEAIVIDVDGTKPVYIRRGDIDLDTAEGRELAIALNRSAEVSITWDTDILKDYDLAGVELGDWFTDVELGDFGIDTDGGAGGTADAEPQTSRADELQKEWGTQLGQLWKLPSRTAGQFHLLACGDSTDKATVERVMMGEKADCVTTDPPYGVDYDGGTTKREKLSGDESPALYLPALTAIRPFCAEHLAFYLWYADGDAAVAQAVAQAGFQVRRNLIWNKNQAQYGALSQQYKQKHEPFLYGHLKGKSPYWAGDAAEVTVWNVDRESVNDLHPTQKPPELFMRAMRNSSKPGNIVFDGFSGSGTTLIAAENLSRQCRAIEISPAYVAVALQRYVDAFGIRPELVG